MTYSKIKRWLAPLLLGGSLAAAGCAGSTRVSAGVSYGGPPLVQIGSGVYVTEGYSEPVFYADDYYWLYDGGIWYRSTYYNGGFARVSVSSVPYGVRRIDRPTRYRNYRAGANANYYRHNARAYRRQQARDRRQARRVRQRRQAERRREIRRDRREIRQERRENRREARRDRRADRRENRREARRDRQNDRREARRDRRRDRRDDRRR